MDVSEESVQAPVSSRNDAAHSVPGLSSNTAWKCFHSATCSHVQEGDSTDTFRLGSGWSKKAPRRRVAATVGGLVVKLRRLRIIRFRNVSSGTELAFADGFNVLLGKNATGKTSLLKLLEAVAQLSFVEFEEEEFEIEFEWLDDDFRAVIRVANKRSVDAVVLNALPPNKRERSGYVSSAYAIFSLGTKQARIEATVETADGKTVTRISGKEIPHKTAAQPTQRDFGFRLLENVPDEEGSLARTLIAMAESRRFDESLGYYTRIKSETFPIVGMSSVQDVQFFPRGFLLCSQDRAKSLNEPTLTFKDTPLNHSLRDALGVPNADIQLTLLSKDADGEATYGNLRFWLSRRDGSQYSDDHHLSFGQKRLLSFLYYLESFSEIVIADELVNGLHHDWIDLCVKSIEKRQAFLTSQNPLLMDYIEFDSVEEVRRSFILCELEFEGDLEVLKWRNMTVEEAGAVFQAAEIGIEHLSTILRNEHLW